jgi:hypothetical protein
MNGVTDKVIIRVGVRKVGSGGLENFRARISAGGIVGIVGQSDIPTDGTLAEIPVSRSSAVHGLEIHGPHSQTHLTRADGKPLRNYFTSKGIRPDQDQEHWFDFEECPELDGTTFVPAASRGTQDYKLPDGAAPEVQFNTDVTLSCSKLTVIIDDQRSGGPKTHYAQVQMHTTGGPLTRVLEIPPGDGTAVFHVRNTTGATYVQIWQDGLGLPHREKNRVDFKFSYGFDTNKTLMLRRGGHGNPPRDSNVLVEVQDR